MVTVDGLYRRYCITPFMRCSVLYYLSIQIVIIKFYMIHVNKCITSSIYRVLGLASTFDYDRYAYGNNNPL